MNKLVLSDEILLTIDKPARYIGNELNSVQKNPADVQLRCVMCFPDVYEIGMSHLGIQILYDQFNQRDDVYCERVYSPWPDLHSIMKEQHIPLFSLETQTPIKEFDFLGITLQYEMCYTNVLQILDLSNIPFHTCDRTEDDPIVCGGGPCAYNPEPIADFFDLFYMGECETSYDELLDLLKQGLPRKKFLHQASKIPGIYVPSLYEPSYNDDGTLSSFDPIYEDVPSVIEKQIVMNPDDIGYPKHPIVPFIRATQDRVVMEIQRGCIRGCRFCQAGMIYRPTRERSIEQLEAISSEMIKSTGHEEICLSSLSSSDYSNLPNILEYLLDNFKKKGVDISLPSLRVDAFSLEIIKEIQDVKKSSLTFAPEAGTQRMRDVINKGLTKEDILHGAGLAFDAGWQNVKLYFMLGLPTETLEDIEGIPKLAEEVAERYYEVPKEERKGRCQVTISTSFFVPKPFTPFQWATMCTKEEYLNRAHTVNDTLRKQINRKSMKYNWHEADVTILEGIFARGDRRVAPVIELAYKKGCYFDAWSEYFNFQTWVDAFKECDVDMDFYTIRQRSLDELFPWDFIDVGVNKSFLRHEYQQAIDEVVTPNCRQQCSGCGAAKYQGGVCIENKN